MLEPAQQDAGQRLSVGAVFAGACDDGRSSCVSPCVDRGGTQGSPLRVPRGTEGYPESGATSAPSPTNARIPCADGTSPFTSARAGKRCPCGRKIPASPIRA